MKTNSPRKSSRSGGNQIAVTMRKLSDVRPCPTNPRTHSNRQLKDLARSIAANGFVNPILVDRDGEIIAGHGRYEAASMLALETVPVIVLGHLSDAAKRAYRIADNRLAEGSSWSIEMLRLEVDSIIQLDASFDLSLTGFDVDDLALKFDVADSHDVPSDPPIPVAAGAPVSRLGDKWQIGEHRLICGDATDPAAYRALLGRERAAMVFTDAPYNVKIDGHVSGLGKIRHREFVAGSGEMSPQQFKRLLIDYMTQCAAFSRDGSLHYHFMDWKHLPELLAAGQIAYEEYKNLCIWCKTNAGMGSLYRSQHEAIAVFKSGSASHVNNVELGKNGRNRTNVWSYAGMNTFAADRDDLLALHPTVKPVALVRDAILDASRRDDIILDPFGGSGTTLLAADAVRRRARLIELDPLYCDVIVRRAQAALGLVATLGTTGRGFAEVAMERGAPDV